MSSPDEVSFRGTNWGPESGEHTERRRFAHGFPRGHGPGPGPEEKVCLQVSRPPQYDSWLDREEMDGRSVIWGCEGRPGTPVDDRGDNLDFVQQLAIEGTSFGQHIANREAWGIHGHQSPPSCAAEPISIWGDSDASTLRRSMRPQTSTEGKQVTATQLHPRGPGRGRAWMTPRRSAMSRVVTSDDIQCPSSSPESSDEFSETQMMRVTICLKEGNQPKSAGLTEQEDPARHTNVHGRESFVHVPPSMLASTPRGLGSAIEKQASGELESSSAKKKQTMVWSKEGGRPSHQGATAAAAAAATASASASATATATASTVAPAPVAVASAGLYKISPRKKPAQEKPSQWDTSRGPVARIFPPWGQRLKSATVEPATFPPISGVALLGKASKCSLPSGPKEFKSICTGKKSIAKKTREPQAGPKEDNSPRDPGLQAQVPLHRAEQPSVCMYRGEMSRGDFNIRAPQVPANPQFFSLSQRCARPRAPPAPAGEQNQLMDPIFPNEESQQVIHGTPGCAQCEMLQKEIDELKEQLAIMQVFKEKFQDP